MSKKTVSRLTMGGVVVLAAVLVMLTRSESASQGKAKEVGEPSRPTAAETPPRLVKAQAPPQPAPDASPAPAPPLTAPHDARPPSPAAQLVESSLMERLRSAHAAGQHALAIQLAREGNRRFPDSALAPERHSILVHSLADNEQRNDARGEAEFMVNHYADSEWVREVERFTGAHRHRNVRLNDAGEIEYY